tara:strand:+ start:35 stop:439 length:405 start_codon:yes stop_codon:yes gene_type:complete
MSCGSIEQNLATVDAHMRGETADPAEVMHLYDDAIVLDMPTRNLRLSTMEAIEANYRSMFGAMELISMEPVERFATEERVVDDMIVRFVIVKEGIANAPYPVGSTVELRLLHVFHMKDAKIMHEKVFEGWKKIA